MSKEQPTYKEFQARYNKGWSDWRPLDERSIEQLPEFPGVYEVCTKNYSFPRLRDTASILYIGSTYELGLKKRIKSLINGKHVARQRIKGIADVLEVELAFRFKVELQGQQVEKELIEAYAIKHLELPPCNHSMPKAKKIKVRANASLEREP